MFITGHFAGLPEFWDEFRREEIEELMAGHLPTSDTDEASPADHGLTRHAEQRFTEPDVEAIAEAGTGDIAF